MMRGYCKTFVITGMLLSAVICFTAEKQDADKKEDVKKFNTTVAKKLDNMAANLSPNTGKVAVVKRLAALFKGSADPIIPTKKFIPAEPYISTHDIISKDPLVPARTMIIYRLRFMLADSKSQDAIEGLVGESGTVEISEKQNIVIINVLKERAEAIKAALLALDQPIPQILVETQVVEVIVQQGEQRDFKATYTKTDGSTGTTDTYGFDVSGSGTSAGNDKNTNPGFNFSPISTKDKDGGSEQLNLAMKWLMTSTDSKILASPNLIAELGTDAKMSTGEEIPYSEAAVTNTAVSQNIKFKKTGINLSIKPVIINPDTVRLEIKPEIIIAVRYQTFEASGSKSVVPVVSIRNISTTLTAADGEVIMLGGLYSSESSTEDQKTPFLSDLPVIGDLFTGKNVSVNDKQLLFFMKIHILKTPYSVMLDPEHNAAAMQDIGRALRDSGTLFKQKPPVEPEDHNTYFTIDSFLHPKAIFPEKIGNEVGEEKRPAPRKLNIKEDRKSVEQTSAEGPVKGK